MSQRRVGHRTLAKVIPRPTQIACMRYHHFFIPASWLNSPSVTLRDDTARQIKTVLRMQPGDTIIVLDNTGTEYTVRLTTFTKDTIAGEIVFQGVNRAEPTRNVTLYQATLKGQKFETVLQKGTELGVNRFVPTLFERSVVKDRAAITHKYDRWGRIIREAAEQSGRGRLPELAPVMSFDEAIKDADPSLGLLFWEAAIDHVHKENLRSVLEATILDDISVFIGPEGGISDDEVVEANDDGLHMLSLGPRILRAETAGLVACAAIFYELNEWNSP